MPSLCQRLQESRGRSKLRGLFEAEGNLEELWLAVGAAEEGDTHGQSGDLARRDGDIGIPGHGRGGGTAAHGTVAIDQIRYARRSTGGRRHIRAQARASPDEESRAWKPGSAPASRKTQCR